MPAVNNALAADSGIDVTDPTMPVLSSDEMVSGQTLFCYDFSNSDTIAQGASGATLANAVFNNIVPGGPGGTIDQTANFGSGGFINMAGSNASLRCGAETDFDLATLNAPILQIYWYCMTGTTTNYNFLCGRTGQLYIANANVAGSAPSVQMPGQVVPTLPRAATLKDGESTHPLNVWRQFAIAWVPDVANSKATVTVYLDGVVNYAFTVPSATLAAKTAGYPWGRTPSGFANAPRKVGRSFLTRLDLIPDTDHAAIVAADYALHATEMAARG